MTFSKRQLKKAATYSVIVPCLFLEFQDCCFCGDGEFLASLAPAPFGFVIMVMGLLCVYSNSSHTLSDDWKPSIYLVRLKPDAKMTPNHYGHRYFHSKAELKVWMKENESKVHDISLANWEEIVLE